MIKTNYFGLGHKKSPCNARARNPKIGLGLLSFRRGLNEQKQLRLNQHSPTVHIV